MESLDFKSEEGLKKACQQAEISHSSPGWRSELMSFLQDVKSAGLQERTTVDFQHRLWEESPVSSSGMGTVKVDRAIEDSDFREWLAEQSVRELPEDPAGRTAILNDLHKQILERLANFCDRMPRLKLLRVLAALFPTEFTTVAHDRALGRLLRQMGLSGGQEPVVDNRRVLDRLAEVLGPVDTADLEAVTKRMTLPWMLIALAHATLPDATMISKAAGEELLMPLSAARRRKGLTAFSGYFQEMLSILEFVQDKPTRDELIDYIRAQKPDLKESSIRTQINSLRSEFNVLRQDGDRYLLTERGEAVLETSNPDELRDWLLTRIFGIDHILVGLKERSLERGELFKLVRQANQNWKSDFGASAIVTWLSHLNLLAIDDEGLIALTDRGNEWCEWIDWEPEKLEVSSPIPEVRAVLPDPSKIGRPKIAVILKKIQDKATFPEVLIKSLHMGLWANERRHFAILTGLSGSGKTLLAREYGKALTGTEDDISDRCFTIPVQPGWYDPTPILGYVNPLVPDTYESTRFLDLLIRAAGNPADTHVAILDEMNLSHPEQYLAPLLSAMETGEALELHNRGEHFDGVPGRIPYPNNLVLIGTVNMDETTLGLSDKVLDRAFTIEFWDINIDQWPGWGARGLSQGDEATIQAVLHGLMEALKPARMHFGWRIIEEVVGFVGLRDSEGDGLPIEEALDRVIYAKLLPKLRGEDSQRFVEALVRCAEVLETHSLENSRTKVQELQSDLEIMGSARFWR